MRFVSIVLRLAAVLVTAVLLFAAMVLAGPFRSGALWLAAGPPERAHQHDLPHDYRPVHRGHVELSDGLYVREDEDLVLPGTPPFILRRKYRTRDRRSRPFGIGASDSGEWYLYSRSASLQWAELILEDGGRVHFDRMSTGESYSTALFENWSDPTEFYGARLGWSGYDWVLREYSGAVGRFLPCSAPGTVCTMTRWRDADGHLTRFTRDTKGRLRRIDAGTQWITLGYDDLGRVTEARASTGHTMHYRYDDAGRLRRAESSDGVTRLYDYDSADQLTRIEEPGRIVENRYDAQGMWVYQRAEFPADPARGLPADPEPYIAEAHYVADGDQMRTDFLESGAPPIRYQFNTRGGRESEIYYPDTAKAITVIYDRDPETKFVSAVTVTCPGQHRWKLSHTLPTEPGSQDQSRDELMSRWCAPVR